MACDWASPGWCAVARAGRRDAGRSSSKRTMVTPARMSAPPANCAGVGSWPSSSQANAIANSTSDMDTNEASLAPSLRAAPMPVTYEITAATRDSPSTGTSQLTWWPRTRTSPVPAFIGSAPVPATAASAAAPTHMLAHVMTSGGSGSSPPPAESRKNVARPTAPSSAQITPARLIPAEPARLSTIASPAIATAPPVMVSRRGRWPCRSQSQPTTSTTPRYSSSTATPTGIRATASK